MCWTGLQQKTSHADWPGLTTHLTDQYREGSSLLRRHHNVGLTTEMIRLCAWAWKARKDHLMRALWLIWYNVCAAAGRSWKNMYIMVRRLWSERHGAWFLKGIWVSQDFLIETCALLTASGLRNASA